MQHISPYESGVKHNVGKKNPKNESGIELLGSQTDDKYDEGLVLVGNRDQNLSYDENIDLSENDNTIMLNIHGGNNFYKTEKTGNRSNK
jgi:metallophosphoesterase superfamily enzyme